VHQLVVGRFRPSQPALGCWQSPMVGSSCPRLTYADCGRWWPAQPRVQPNYPVPFSAPAGRARGRDTRRWSPGHRPGRGSPRRPGCSSPAESAELRASGSAEWRRAYVGSWIAGCRRPFPGDCVLQSSPRSAASPLRGRVVDSSVVVRVGLLIPKATG
jgi:hypothetical protein